MKRLKLVSRAPILPSDLETAEAIVDAHIDSSGVEAHRQSLISAIAQAIANERGELEAERNVLNVLDSLRR